MTPALNGACEIRLRNRGVTIVDVSDYAELSRFKWRQDSSGYVSRSKQGRSILMHRVLVNPEPGQQVDHIDGDPLNNRRSNLRPCTIQQNAFNGKKKRAYLNGPCSSRYRGVTLHRQTGKWQASLTRDRQFKYLGLFSTEEEAAAAFDRGARAAFGEFARLNFPLVAT